MGINFPNDTPFAFAAATSVTLPTHKAGDLIVIAAFRTNGSSTPPTQPAGYISSGTNAETGGPAMRVGYKFAASASETSGTWSNTNLIYALVIRGVDTLSTLQCPVTANHVASATAIYPAVPTEGQCWVFGFGCVMGSTTSSIDTPPAGMTAIDTRTSGSDEVGLFYRSNPTPDSWRDQNVPLGGSSSWVATTLPVQGLNTAPLPNKYATNYVTRPHPFAPGVAR